MSLSWTQPTCEACWIADHTIWPVDPDGSLLGVERPVTVRESPLEQCSYCGQPTIVGIYTRADPMTVPFPREKEE